MYNPSRRAALRQSFGKIAEILPMPDLILIQVSRCDLFWEGWPRHFSTFPDSRLHRQSGAGVCRLTIWEPKYSVEESKERDDLCRNAG